ncbi:hypothetical protein Gorai_014851, partial [Gossypium raimondii]|nr:hypothetical protein [Gossypium raimondii]
MLFNCKRGTLSGYEKYNDKSMASIGGIQISDLGDKRYLFKCFLEFDIERVLRGTPWTFDYHLLDSSWNEGDGVGLVPVFEGTTEEGNYYLECMNCLKSKKKFAIKRYWRLPIGKPTRYNETTILECPWIGEFTGCAASSAYA